MKKAIVTLLFSVVFLAVFAQITEKGPPPDKKRVSAEVVSVDVGDKQISFKSEKGETRTLRVMGKAVDSLKALKSGQKVVLTIHEMHDKEERVSEIDSVKK